MRGIDMSNDKANRLTELIAEAQELVAEELEKAILKFPTWPTDPLHAVAVVNEEIGELNKAILQYVYEPHKADGDEVRKEAIQAAAMTLRFLISLDQLAYVYNQSAQHFQG